MQELVERSGMTRTRIHYYQREGLLPPPHKTAPNAAHYDEDHLERLHFIQRLRDDRMQITQIRRVLTAIEAGADPETALGLEAAIFQGEAFPDTTTHYTRRQLVHRSKLDASLLDSLIEKGYFGEPGATRFDNLDLKMANALAGLLGVGITPDEVIDGSGKIFEISAEEFAIGMRCLEGKSPAQQNEIKLTMQKCSDFSKRYLFIRARQHDIARVARERQAQENGKNDEE
jgi:DNA-binding transcriptional MerR regulator